MYLHRGENFFCAVESFGRGSMVFTCTKTENQEKRMSFFQGKRAEKGTWRWEREENLNGVYYDFRLSMDGEQVWFGDPYARACGVNGKRSMAVLLESTDPKGWKEDKAPAKAEENIIYEIHVKEFSWDRSGGFPEKTVGNIQHLQKNIPL